MIGILFQVTVRNFNEPPLPNLLFSVDPNSIILSNNLVLIIKNIINTVTWKGGRIKLIDQIVIIIINIICILPQLIFFSRSNNITTNNIISFVTFIYFIDIYGRNDTFYYFIYPINFFTGTNFSFCSLLFLLII